MQKSLQTAFEVECKVRRIISEQAETGVLFNARRARRYLRYIDAKKSELYSRIRPLLALEVVQPYNTVLTKLFNKDGTHSHFVKKWFGDQSHLVWGGNPKTKEHGICRVEFREPDIGSRKKLQAQLIRLGWKPRHFTEKGSPKLTYDSEPCPSLTEIDSQVGKDIALWYTLNHRMSQIKGWLDRLRSDSRLSGEAFTIGTPTYRFRHKTVVNVPKAASHVIFGKQMRSLFTVPRAAEGYRQYLEWKEKQK